jgi:hypothetical protein
MLRTVDQAFDIFLDRLTPLQSERQAAAKHRQSVEGAIKTAMTVRSFRETGSFHHGTGVRGQCDVDLLVSIGRDRPVSSDTALGWIKDALQARFPYTKIRVSRPAVVAEFGSKSEMWEIIPGFLTSRGGKDVLVYDIPGAASGWMDTAPIEHLHYVNECNQLPKTTGGAKKLARLAKAWKYYNNVPVSSFYLEMRAAQHVATQNSFIPVWDIWQLLNSLERHELAGMNDPKGAAGRFYPCSSDARKAEALSKLHTGATRADKALDAYRNGKSETAFEYLNLLFGGKFPSRWA